jgi:GTP-binding protein
VLSVTRLQAGGGDVKLFSALKKQGIDDVALQIWRWAHAAPLQASAQDTPTTATTDLSQAENTEKRPQH